TRLEVDVKTLYVMYDAHCGLCTEVRNWLRRQPAYLKVHLLASDSEEARSLFPTLNGGELAVVSDDGRVWLGDHAFIMCLWALRGFRRWARRLTAPMLRPLARQAFAAVSEHRHGVSSLLGLSDEFELRERLRHVRVSECRIK